MTIKKLFSGLLWILLVLLSFAAHSEPVVKPFVSGSYQQILASHAKQPFMLVVWSVDCSSCIKDMALLSEMHKQNPNLKMVMLATDELSVSEQVTQLLMKYQLESVENWLFADENSQKLRYEIDSKWYGELPRTYFFNAAHKYTGISGVMTKKDYEKMLAKMIK